MPKPYSDVERRNIVDNEKEVRLLQKIANAAFAHPQGLFGRLGGFIMEHTTRERNEWTLSLLTFGDDERILEVGSGPGALIEAMLTRVPHGFIAGLDASPVMVEQATRRNKQAIRDGRVEVRQGSALALPYADASFDKALAANSVPFWPDQLAGVQEMRRVLTTGGTIALILQPRWVRTDDEVRTIGTELVALLQKAGFLQTRLEFRPMKPMASVCALGVK